MAEKDRDNVAKVFRQHALRIEATAFEQSSRLNEDIISELVDIAARFTEVADMLEDAAGSRNVMQRASPQKTEDTPSEANGVDHDS